MFLEMLTTATSRYIHEQVVYRVCHQEKENVIHCCMEDPPSIMPAIALSILNELSQVNPSVRRHPDSVILNALLLEFLEVGLGQNLHLARGLALEVRFRCTLKAIEIKLEDICVETVAEDCTKCSPGDLRRTERSIEEQSGSYCISQVTSPSVSNAVR